MNTQRKIVTIAGFALAAGTASAQVTITQSNAAAPTYSTTLNFDEVGGPTGSVAGNAWAGIGLADMIGGAGPIWIADNDAAVGGWGLGSGNSAYGSFGVFMTFSSDLSEFSTQFWDASGPASFFGGGAIVVALDGGVEVSSLFIDNPPYGGIGDTWIDITTAGGATFDEVRILGFGFTPDTYVDNLSWNAVPTPASAALLGLGGLVATRRRRA